MQCILFCMSHIVFALIYHSYTSLQVDKYKNISMASEQRLAALEQRNKELLATVSSTATRGEICTMSYSVRSAMYGTP
jgi:energy-converting hydrogenase Eha subunit H